MEQWIDLLRYCESQAGDSVVKNDRQEAFWEVANRIRNILTNRSTKLRQQILDIEKGIKG